MSQLSSNMPSRSQSMVSAVWATCCATVIVSGVARKPESPSSRQRVLRWKKWRVVWISYSASDLWLMGRLLG
jgi:hypothetical protein